METDLWQAYRGQGGLVLALGDEEIDKIIAWREDRGVSFPMLLMQDTYDLHVDPKNDTVYALDIVTDKNGKIRHAAHGSTTAELVAVFEQLLGE